METPTAAKRAHGHCTSPKFIMPDNGTARVVRRTRCARASIRSRLEDPSFPARSRADARRRGGLGLHVRADQGRARRSAAVHARRIALLFGRAADGLLRAAAGDAVARRRRLWLRDRRLPIRPAVPRIEARDAGRALVARDPGAGVLHDRPRRRFRRRSSAPPQPRRRGDRLRGNDRARAYKVASGLTGTAIGFALVIARGVRMGGRQHHRQALGRRAWRRHVRADGVVEPGAAAAAARAGIRVRGRRRHARESSPR